MKMAAADRNRDLYPDRHLNVFVPYRSHALDYNVTRAVIARRWNPSCSSTSASPFA